MRSVVAARHSLDWYSKARRDVRRPRRRSFGSRLLLWVSATRRERHEQTALIGGGPAHTRRLCAKRRVPLSHMMAVGLFVCDARAPLAARRSSATRATACPDRPNEVRGLACLRLNARSPVCVYHTPKCELFVERKQARHFDPAFARGRFLRRRALLDDSPRWPARFTGAGKE